MATANQSSRYRPRRRMRYWLLAAGLCAALLIAFWGPVSGFARVGAAYGARVGCSCRFVGGRSLGDCRKDFEPGMELVTLSENTQAKSVTARFALVYPQTATYREGPGCVLEPWGN